MYDRVRAQHGPGDRHLGKQTRHSVTIPSASVFKIQEGVLRRVQGPVHAPEKAHKNDEAEGVPNQADDLQHGEDAGPERVQHDGDEQQREDDEEQLPGRHGVVGPREVDAHLHQLGAHVGAAGEARDPAQAAHPAARVRGLLLPTGWRELGHPVVLAPRRGRHAAHLGEAEHHGRVAGHAADKGPEEAAVARGAERGRHGDDGELPGGHVDGNEAEGGPEREVAAELLGFSQAGHVGHILIGLVGGRRCQDALWGGDLEESVVFHYGDVLRGKERGKPGLSFLSFFFSPHFPPFFISCSYCTMCSVKGRSGGSPGKQCFILANTGWSYAIGS